MDPLIRRIVSRFAPKVAAKAAVESLKKALGEIDYLPNAAAAWLDAHGKNKHLAAENAKEGQASG